MTESAIYGKNVKKGIAPAIALCNPKYPRNVGAAIRTASCFGIKQVWFTGNRVSLDPNGKDRLPREERMRGYNEVELRQCDYFFDCFEDVVPVAVELIDGAELLPYFEHPENALYVFGPEDGSLNQVTRRLCHRRVVIPTRHCVNLAVAISLILYDRQYKRQLAGLEEILPMKDLLASEKRQLFPKDKLFEEEDMG